MIVYIVRHGKAEHDPSIQHDEDRALTNRGVRQANYLAERIASHEGPPALILTSPLTRALQTAKAIHGAIGGTLQEEPTLEPGHGASELLSVLRARADNESLMLVGHNPQLAELVWVLSRGLPADQVILRTGECVVLDVK